MRARVQVKILLGTPILGVKSKMEQEAEPVKIRALCR